MMDRIHIEISNICNLQCSFCPVVERDKKVMSLEKVQHAVLQAKAFSKQICLHLMGEPLAHPEFEKIVSFCEEQSVSLQITTNGILLQRYQEILCSKAVRQINFSLQSFTDNFKHKPIDEYLFKILKFTKYLEQRSPDCYVNLRLWNNGIESKENELIFRLVEKFYEVTINRNVDVSFKKSKKVWNKVYLHFDSRFEWPSLEIPDQGSSGRCNGLKTHIGIHADGSVVPCCLDKEANINLGNVFEEDLSEIINSERAVRMKRGFENNKRVEDFCRHCSYINRFK
ncbi:MAG: radical SAM protein [Bdellovibrionaceae bacterium]|nr:radical SAM protein [Pseudobdellovibrionaceae bacterium]|tara:strand:+ start:3756 stop:4607 length:852 start_codon:yes stop_codon:yes gene_type:complete